MFARSVRTPSSVAVALLAAAAFGLPRTMAGQSATIDRLEREPVRWQVLYEATATVGTRWFGGTRAPRVTTPLGGGGGIGLQRAIGPEVRGGVMLRALAQPITLAEAGASWSGGTMREINVLGLLDRIAAERGSWQLLLNAAAGVAVVSGTPDILPFAELGLLQPLGEAGVIVRRTPAIAPTAGHHIELLARVGVTRLNATGTRPLMASGWSNRFTLGLRVTR